LPLHVPVWPSAHFWSFWPDAVISVVKLLSLTVDFTVDVLQPQANARTPQLLTICFLLIAVCVFTGKLTNVSVLPYCGRRWGKKLPTIQQKTKNCFLPSSYSKYYEPVSL